MPDFRRDVLIEPVLLLAPWIPVASQIHIAVRLDVRELECAKGIHIIMKGCISVPGSQEACPVGVDEHECGGERVVLVDDVAKIRHRFMAFVHRSGQGRGRGGVDSVDCSLPTGTEIRHWQDDTREEFEYLDGEETHSGRFAATHSVSSFSNLAMTMTLSPTLPEDGAWTSSVPCLKEF